MPYVPTSRPARRSPARADPTTAPTLAPGSYVDRIGGVETTTGTLNYRVERSIPGSSITVAATILTPYYVDRSHSPDDWDRIDLDLSTSDGQSCEHGDAVQRAQHGCYGVDRDRGRRRVSRRRRSWSPG